MARIVIRNLEKSFEVSDFSKTILQHVQEFRLDWMHACGGKGNCTTCKAVVLQGENNFSPLTQAELRYKKLGLLLEDERLACQARISGDIRIEVPDEGKLPHLTYVS